MLQEHLAKEPESYAAFRSKLSLGNLLHPKCAMLAGTVFQVDREAGELWYHHDSHTNPASGVIGEDRQITVGGAATCSVLVSACCRALTCAVTSAARTLPSITSFLHHLGRGTSGDVYAVSMLGCGCLPNLHATLLIIVLPGRVVWPWRPPVLAEDSALPHHTPEALLREHDGGCCGSAGILHSRGPAARLHASSGSRDSIDPAAGWSCACLTCTRCAAAPLRAVRCRSLHAVHRLLQQSARLLANVCTI